MRVLPLRYRVINPLLSMTLDDDVHQDHPDGRPLEGLREQRCQVDLEGLLTHCLPPFYQAPLGLGHAPIAARLPAKPQFRNQRSKDLRSR